MLDTVRVQSPFIDERTARLVSEHLERRTALSYATGELRYDFTSGPLEGTWDSRVSVQVERTKLVVQPGQRTPVRLPVAPYLTIEGSTHKALLGHNLYGGPVELQPAVRCFLADVSDALDVFLPNFDQWTYRRIDWAEVFDLGSLEAVVECLAGYERIRFPRRQPQVYPGEAVYFPGTTTTLKMYGKGAEFGEHDRKRILRAVDRDTANELQDRANGLLRCETEVRQKALDELATGIKPTVGRLREDLIVGVHDRDWLRLIREGESAMQPVRTYQEVKGRLYAAYSDRQARALLGTWMELSAHGEKLMRQDLRPRTFYDHRKKLLEAGCRWDGGDIVSRASLVPEGFVPLRHDPRRLTAVDPAVEVALAPWRAA